MSHQRRKLFLSNLGRHIADEMPQGWVHEQLRTGNAIVLVDGVDELPPDQRDEMREWLRDLIDTFPESRYIVTSRPGAAGSNWLHEEQFISLELQPMTSSDIRLFISQWHSAIKSQLSDNDAIQEIDEYERRLLGKLHGQRYLRILAETPLLCALLCALHRDRRAHLPHNRMELYEVALDMLLERRDSEQQIAGDVVLSRTHKTLLLQDIAYWMVKNGHSEVEKEWIVRRIEAKLPAMSISVVPSIVYRNLLERSGLLREPVTDYVDFVHRSFQEYLAALDALAQEDIGLLVDNAHLDQWREVVIMAAGRAYPKPREKLLTGLIRRGDGDESHRDQLYLLAVACLETSPELPIEIRSEIRARVTDLLPPRNITIAKSLALAGEFVTDLLAQAKPRGARETASTVRAAAEIGGEAAFEIIKKYRLDQRTTVGNELIRAWSRFDIDDYAKEIVLHNATLRYRLTISDPDVLPAIKHFPQLVYLFLDYRGQLDLLPLSSLRNLKTLLIQAQTRKLVGMDVFKDLVSLETLDLGAIPLDGIELLASLTNLRSLNLATCQLREIGALSGLNKLQVLNCNNNEISDVAPLRAMEDLETLRLNGTGVSDISPLQAITKLIHLELGGTKVSDLTPLASMTKLRKLQLEDTGVTDVSILRGLLQLMELRMAGTSVSDLSALSSLNQLRFLDIGETKVSDLEALAQNERLFTLLLPKTEVSDISPLAGLKSLRRVDLSGTNVTNIQALAGHRYMTNLQLANTEVTDISVVADMPALYTLDISNTRVSDLSPLVARKRFIGIRMLGSDVYDLRPLSGVRVHSVALSSKMRNDPRLRIPEGLSVHWINV